MNLATSGDVNFEEVLDTNEAVLSTASSLGKLTWPSS